MTKPVHPDPVIACAKKPGDSRKVSGIDVIVGSRTRGEIVSEQAEPSSMPGQLRQIRNDVSGPDGLPELARSTGIPVMSLWNYESGFSISGPVLLPF